MGVRDALVGQVAHVVATDRALRSEALGSLDSAAGVAAVHDARVAVRRVRSLLRVFPELSDDAVAEALSAWSDMLGAVREAHVLAATLAAVCPPELWRRLAPELVRERAAAVAELGVELDAPEHRRLLEDLEALALRPKSGRLHKRRRVRRAAKLARKRLRTAAEDPELLHRARKAAKRARYAAEAVGDGATAGRWEAVQDALGEQHDCVVALRRLADVPGERAAQARRALAARAAEAFARRQG
jgi:CHAD domain-containing protein